MKKPNFRFLFSLCGLFITLNSCDDCKPNYVVEKNTLQKLHDLSTKTSNSSENATDIEVYIDYSDGMHPAILACNQVFDEVLNIAQHDNTRYLVCGRSDSLNPLTRSELDRQYDPKNAKSFVEPLSILDKPLERILKEGKQAIYITDFEMTFRQPTLVNVQGGKVMSSIDLSLDWATAYFDKWLSGGNSIDVFAKPFMKPRKKTLQNQHLYFLVFTPKGISNNPIVDGLLKLSQTVNDLKHLSFSKTRFQTTTNYEKQEQQGLNENIGLRTHELGNGFEYYQIKFDDLKRLEKVEDKRILEKLYLNQQLEGFTNLTYRLQVEDVTAAYKLLVDSTQCGSGTNLEKLKLNGTIEPEYFELDTKNNNGKIEFGIKKHESFTALNGKNDHQIFKVSILFNSALYQPDIAKMEQILQWQDVNLNQAVPGLYGGLKQAASRMDLKDTPVYTYYIEVVK